MFLRGKKWWLRYTPRPGAPQVRESLDTEFESVAAARAIAILHRAPLDASGEFEAELEAYIADQTRLGILSRTFAPSRLYVLRAFARDAGVESIADLSKDRVERWLEAKREGSGGADPVRPGTIESYLMSVRAFCGWLVDKNKLRENPTLKIELGKVSRAVRKNFLGAETVRMLIEKAPDDDLRFVLYCGFHAGMRRLEIVEARRDWFVLGVGERRGRIQVARTPTFVPKDKDERVIPLSRDFEKFLRGYLPDRVTDDFVLKPKVGYGRHKYRYDFRRPFTTHMTAHGVKCTPHDMRRTFVSLKLIEDSSLVFKVAKWTGDGVQVIQDHYAHLLSDDGDIDTGL